MTNVPLTIPPGITRPSTDTIAANRWWDANLVRWPSKVMQPVGGWSRITQTPLGTPPRLILSWRDLDDIRRTLVMCDGGLYTLEGSIFTNRTPVDYGADDGDFTTAGFGIGPYSDSTFGSPRVLGNPRLYYRATTWSADTFGEDMLALASSDGRLWLLSPGATVTHRTAQPRDLPPLATEILAAPKPNMSMLVTEERHVMLFGAGGNPRRIAWSSREDYNDWDFANLNNTAGFFDLDIHGWIVNATKVRGGVLIFTDSGVWMARYRGVPFIYSFEQVGSACGILAPHAFATAAGLAMWQGQRGFWTYNGGTLSPIPCEIADYIFDNLDPHAGPVRAHACSNGVYQEVFFFWPSTGQKECDNLAIFCFETGNFWWSKGALARSAMDTANVYPYPLAGSPQGHIYQHEDGWLDGGLPRAGQIYAETGALSFPAAGDRRVHVLQAQMDNRPGTSVANVTAYARETHNGPEEVYGPYAPRDDGFTDMRFSGRDIRLRFTQGSEGDWTLGQMRFDIRPAGRR